MCFCVVLDINLETLLAQFFVFMQVPSLLHGIQYNNIFLDFLKLKRKYLIGKWMCHFWNLSNGDLRTMPSAICCNKELQLLHELVAVLFSSATFV